MSNKKGNKKKDQQLGMSHGTATNKLRKAVMFSLVQQVGLDRCYRCGETIDDIDTLSMEHKVPWLDSEDPVRLFFDLSNIAFSHIKCNVAGARKTTKGTSRVEHGTATKYGYGCRCPHCTTASSKDRRRWPK